MSQEQKYELVVGLEIHAQLQTASKAFCSDETTFGALPNTQVSAISLGHPGTLPVQNKKVIEHAIMLGLALKCTITEENQYARKNYFYADLPKGYQITQDKTPICTAGFVEINTAQNENIKIPLIRIHIEEDSGKSMHDQDLEDSLIDYNRAGMPLVEIVTEPAIRTPEEAYLFISEVRKLVRHLDICDGNMEEGSLRCDANVSIRPFGSNIFGTKVEVKNMNSMSNVKRAISFEYQRQVTMIEAGQFFESETRGFNPLDGSTFSMRAKELVKDYRYFPEPDLPPFIVDKAWQESIKAIMPMLPRELETLMQEKMELPKQDSLVLSEDKQLSNYFLAITEHTKQYKAAANWVLGVVKNYLNEKAIHINQFNIDAKRMAELIDLVAEEKISNTAAAQTVFPEMAVSKDSPLEIATRLNVIQNKDEGFIGELVDNVLNLYPEKVIEYKAGKTNLLGLFVGEVMKASKGKADPKIVNTEIIKKLK